MSYIQLLLLLLGVLTAVDAVVSHLKMMSRNVTTPEEIAQVSLLAVMDFCSVGLRLA